MKHIFIQKGEILVLAKTKAQQRKGFVAIPVKEIKCMAESLCLIAKKVCTKKQQQKVNKHLRYIRSI